MKRMQLVSLSDPRLIFVGHPKLHQEQEEQAFASALQDWTALMQTILP